MSQSTRVTAQWMLVLSSPSSKQHPFCPIGGSPAFAKQKGKRFVWKYFRSRTSDWNGAHRVCTDWVMIPCCFLFIVFSFIYTWEEPNKKDKRLPGHQTALTKQHFNDLKVEEREHVDYISPKIGTWKNEEKRHVWGFIALKAFQDV